MQWLLRSTHLCFRRSFDDVTRINFRFRLLVAWSSAHGRDASSCKIWRRYLYPVRSYWHFSEFHSRWRPPPSWIFRLCEFGYSRVLTALWVFVFCTKLGKNICNGYWDRRTYASDVHLMTSREITSGFDFLSCGHLRMAVMHLPVKFGADIFIQSGVIDIFPNFKIFRLWEYGHPDVLIVWHLCSVPSWVKIYAMFTEIDELMLQTFIWWRHAN